MIRRLVGPRVPLECPCGIHPADCTYHRDTLLDDLLGALYGADPVSSYWGEALAEEFAKLRREYRELTTAIEASYAKCAAVPSRTR